MTILTFLNLLHFTLVLLFGLLLSVEIADDWNDKENKKSFYFLFPALLALQGILWLVFDTDFVQKIYPLIAHLPLVLFLVFCCKKSWSIAIVCVCTAYLCCQIPHWGQIAIISFTHNQIFAEICYIILIIVTYLLLRRYFVGAVRLVITQSSQTLFLFGSLPVAYYIFDYATTVYSDALYSNIGALNEFLPTVLVVFYVLFLTAYHMQMQKYMQAELHNSVLEMKQKQTQTELAMLRQAETQAAIYQHDMRHHLMMIEGFLRADKPEQAADYIQKTERDIIAITPKRFCENETINLLCGSFTDKAQKQNIQLNIKAKLPKELSVSDTDLCAMLSNGIENALHAAEKLEPPFRYVDFYCEQKQNKLLIEICNPYIDEVIIENGLPISKEAGHGYGCQSIFSIAERHHGHCSFQAEHNMFTLRIVLPVT